MHLALIMDGNGRWAVQRKKPRIWGHQKGAETLVDIIKSCPDMGIKTVTAYVFSTENWKRDPKEISDIFALIEDFLRKKSQMLYEHNIKVKFTGGRHRFSKELLLLVHNLEEKTKNNTLLCLHLAVDYGGRQEIVQAAQHLARRAAKGMIHPDHVNEDLFCHVLGSEMNSDPDLLIRTGGEQRLSNFMLFQNAYTELFFTKVLWPDFQTKHLKSIIKKFKGRDRLFGGARHRLSA